MRSDILYISGNSNGWKNSEILFREWLLFYLFGSALEKKLENWWSDNNTVCQYKTYITHMDTEPLVKYM